MIVDNEKIYPYQRNPLYEVEFALVFHEILSPADKGINTKSQNPLLKLACFQNMDNHNFTLAYVEKISDYYNCIYNFVAKQREISTVEKILILYHTELETRFETFFKILKVFCSYKIKDDEAITLARGFNSNIIETKMANDEYECCRIQNRIFFGCQYHISKFCDIIKNYGVSEATIVQDKIVKLSQLINWILDNLKKEHIIDEKLEFFECEVLQDMYNKAIQQHTTNKNVYEIRLKDFINIFTPDDKRTE